MVAIPNPGSVIPEENTTGAQQVECHLCLMVIKNTKDAHTGTVLRISWASDVLLSVFNGSISILGKTARMSHVPVINRSRSNVLRY